MKLLFLDIDGVLNSTQSTHYYWLKNGRRTVFLDETMFCPSACANLSKLCENIPDLRVVLSSTWRIKHSPKYMENILDKFWYVDKIKFVGATPTLYGEHRGTEILTYLQVDKYLDGKVNNMLILDDDNDMTIFKDTDFFLHVDGNIGFDHYACLKAIEHLKKDYTNELKELIKCQTTG